MWKMTKNGLFLVKSIFDELEGGGIALFPRKMIWIHCVPTKVDFFAW